MSCGLAGRLMALLVLMAPAMISTLGPGRAGVPLVQYTGERLKAAICLKTGAIIHLSSPSLPFLFSLLSIHLCLFVFLAVYLSVYLCLSFLVQPCFFCYVSIFLALSLPPLSFPLLCLSPPPPPGPSTPLSVSLPPSL